MKEIANKILDKVKEVWPDGEWVLIGMEIEAESYLINSFPADRSVSDMRMSFVSELYWELDHHYMAPLMEEFISSAISLSMRGDHAYPRCVGINARFSIPEEDDFYERDFETNFTQTLPVVLLCDGKDISDDSQYYIDELNKIDWF